MLPPAFGSERPSRAQRTSSMDTRPEISAHTLISLFTLLKPREYFLTVDNCPIWRKHMSWAKTDGRELRQLLTNKFGTNMVFMSLLLATEINVLFNSNQMCTQMRTDMEEMNLTPNFWAGVAIIASVISTIFTILTTFAAWSMVSCISDENSHALLRSSIGQYCCFLPSKLIVAAIYSFLIWILLYIYIMMPHAWSVFVVAVTALLFINFMAAFSAFGRLIMHTGAMGSTPIFDPDFEQKLLPRGLHTALFFKAVGELKEGTSVTKQYRHPSRPIGHVDSMDDFEKGETAVQFSESVPVQEDARSSFDVPSQMVSTSSIGSYNQDFVNEWVGRSESAGSAGNRSSFDFDSHSISGSVSASNVPTSVPLPTSLSNKPPTHGRTGSDGSARSSLAKMRPSMLNAGGHRQRSILRMAASMEDGDDDPARSNGRGEGAVAPPRCTTPINSFREQLLRSTASAQSTGEPPDDQGKGAGSSPSTLAGTEREQLLPKPSLRPPAYTRTSRAPPLPPQNGNKTRQHSQGDSDSRQQTSRDILQVY